MRKSRNVLCNPCSLHGPPHVLSITFPTCHVTPLLFYSLPSVQNIPRWHQLRYLNLVNFLLELLCFYGFLYYITSSPLTPRYSIIFGPTILYNGHILFSHLNLYVLARNFHGTIMVLAKHKIRYTNHKMIIRNDNGIVCV